MKAHAEPRLLLSFYGLAPLPASAAYRSERATSLLAALSGAWTLPRGRRRLLTGQFQEMDPASSDDALLPNSLVLPGEASEMVRELAADADPSAVQQTLAPIPFDIGERVCSTWSGTYADAGMGEDYLNAAGVQRVPAAGAQATLSRMVFVHGTVYDFWMPVEVWTGELDAQGCTPRILLQAGYHRLTQKPVIRVSNPGLVFSVYKENNTNMETYSLPLMASGAIYGTISINMDLDTPTTRIATVVSPASWHGDDTGLLAGSSNWAVSEGTCGGMGSSSGLNCFGYPPNGGQHTTKYKFIIMHEMGHQMMSSAAGTPAAPTNWDAPPQYPACRCDHVQQASQQHCLQSFEHYGTAYAEGFGHFVAARHFNRTDEPNCTFVYYKDFREDNGTIVPAPVPKTCSSPVRWMMNHCHGNSNIGVEWDFMNFLWSVNANALLADRRSTMQNLYDIQKTACGGGACTTSDELSWNALAGGAQQVHGVNSLKSMYFAQMGDTYGVIP